MKIGVIGMGNMGTTLANIIATNGNEVIGWEYFPAVVDEINTRHINSKYLPGIKLSQHLKATTNIREVAVADFLFIAIPSPFIRQVIAKAKDNLSSNTVIVNLAKGIEKDTGLTTSQLLSTLLPDNEIIMLSGPSIATELAAGAPTMAVLAGKSRALLLTLAQLVETSFFRVRFSSDLTGVELGGVLKNIYAIGMGLMDGYGLKSHNLKAAYLTGALEEMVTTGTVLGAKPETFYYLAGLGDLAATSLSSHSHNRRLGELLAQGKTLAQIKADHGILPEGVKTLEVVLHLAEKYHLLLPIAFGIRDITEGSLSVEAFVTGFIKSFM